tara:strand:- start:578 stop:952 length:375 start_codon:yes stop_codon:yes gene_type:complete
MYNISNDDLNILIKQYQIEKHIAKELLILNNGDIVNSIVMFESKDFNLNKIKEEKQKYIEEETDNFDVSTSSQENRKRYRDIVDSKDVIYEKNKENKNKNKNNLSLEDLYFLKRKTNFNSIKII